MWSDSPHPYSYWGSSSLRGDPRQYEGSYRSRVPAGVQEWDQTTQPVECYERQAVTVHTTSSGQHYMNAALDPSQSFVAGRTVTSLPMTTGTLAPGFDQGPRFERRPPLYPQSTVNGYDSVDAAPYSHRRLDYTAGRYTPASMCDTDSSSVVIPSPLSLPVERTSLTRRAPAGHRELREMPSSIPADTVVVLDMANASLNDDGLLRELYRRRMDDLACVTVANLDGNRLRKPELTLLKNLNVLSIRNNNLTSLCMIVDMKYLRELYVSGNLGVQKADYMIVALVLPTLQRIDDLSLPEYRAEAEEAIGLVRQTIRSFICRHAAALVNAVVDYTSLNFIVSASLMSVLPRFPENEKLFVILVARSMIALFCSSKEAWEILLRGFGGTLSHKENIAVELSLALRTSGLDVRTARLVELEISAAIQSYSLAGGAMLRAVRPHAESLLDEAKSEIGHREKIGKESTVSVTRNQPITSESAIKGIPTKAKSSDRVTAAKKPKRKEDDLGKVPKSAKLARSVKRKSQGVRDPPPLPQSDGGSMQVDSDDEPLGSKGVVFTSEGKNSVARSGKTHGSSSVEPLKGAQSKQLAANLPNAEAVLSERSTAREESADDDDDDCLDKQRDRLWSRALADRAQTRALPDVSSRSLSASTSSTSASTPVERELLALTNGFVSATEIPLQSEVGKQTEGALRRTSPASTNEEQKGSEAVPQLQRRQEQTSVAEHHSESRQTRIIEPRKKKRKQGSPKPLQVLRSEAKKGMAGGSVYVDAVRERSLEMTCTEGTFSEEAVTADTTKIDWMDVADAKAGEDAPILQRIELTGYPVACLYPLDGESEKTADGTSRILLEFDGKEGPIRRSLARCRTELELPLPYSLVGNSSRSGSEYRLDQLSAQPSRGESDRFIKPMHAPQAFTWKVPVEETLKLRNVL